MDSGVTKMDRAVLRALETNGPLHVTEIATRIDGHPITVDQACARLHDDGFITPIGGGRYRLTEEGSAQIDDDESEFPREQPWRKLFDET